MHGLEGNMFLRVQFIPIYPSPLSILCLYPTDGMMQPLREKEEGMEQKTTKSQLSMRFRVLTLFLHTYVYTCVCIHIQHLYYSITRGDLLHPSYYSRYHQNHWSNQVVLRENWEGPTRDSNIRKASQLRRWSTCHGVRKTQSQPPASVCHDRLDDSVSWSAQHDGKESTRADKV